MASDIWGFSKTFFVLAILLTFWTVTIDTVEVGDSGTIMCIVFCALVKII